MWSIEVNPPPLATGGVTIKIIAADFLFIYLFIYLFAFISKPNEACLGHGRQFRALAISYPGLSGLFLSTLGATWKRLLHCHDTFATSQPLLRTPNSRQKA